jgi:G3E family GTPase
MIDIVLLAGFLGSGKTTVLNELIGQLDSIKLGLLVNDFGEVPVDGSLLKEENPQLTEEGSKIYEIGNGSIFCSCLKAPFLYGLKYFQREKPKLLIIEASGLSDPSGMSKILKEHSLDGDFRIVKILTLVDPIRFAKLAHVLEVIPRQIRAGDFLLINKEDLVTPEEMKKTEELVREINPQAEVQTGSFGRFDFSMLLEGKTLTASGELESCNTPENRPASLLLQGDVNSEAELRAFFDEADGLFYRLKGFIKLEGIIQYVSDTGRGFSLTPTRGEGLKTGLTVLCPPGEGNEISLLWDRYFPQREATP